jgi:hypothetical protein
MTARERPLTAAQVRARVLAAGPWWCESCGRTHPLGDHDPEQPAGRCEFAAGSLYCVRENCTNPNHRDRP